MAAGVLHGVLLLTVVGVVLGDASGHAFKGLPIGAVSGLGGALSYYLFMAVGDTRPYGRAIPAAWVVMWLLLATLDGRWTRAPRARSWLAAVTRGFVAAATAGVAFSVVRETLWGRPAGGERNYLLQFAAWAVAWTPGLLALTWERAVRPAETAATSAASSMARSSEPQTTATSAADASSISGTDLLEAIDRGELLHVLDVRSEGEFAAGHVPGAVNIPFNQIPFRLADVPGTPDEALIVYCGHGPRAYMAGAALRHGGRARLVYMTGHFAVWEREGLRIER